MPRQLRLVASASSQTSLSIEYRKGSCVVEQADRIAQTAHSSSDVTNGVAFMYGRLIIAI
jgi:hypothetical protein